MDHAQLAMFATAEQEEIINALMALAKSMGHPMGELDSAELEVEDENGTTRITLSIVLDDELKVAISTTKDGLDSDMLGFSMTVEDSGEMHITNGVYQGEDMEFEIFGKEYLIVETLEELTNISEECLTESEKA